MQYVFLQNMRQVQFKRNGNSRGSTPQSEIGMGQVARLRFIDVLFQRQYYILYAIIIQSL
jgi:hypothetical protein